MFCINCFYPTTSVVNSRPNKEKPLVWRRRKCTKCGHNFTTEETPALRENKVIYKDGKQVPFNLGKLTISIAKAFPHSENDAEYSSFELARTIEKKLSTEVEYLQVADIAAFTHETLKRFDEIAGMQYAMQHGLLISVRKRGRPSVAWHEQSKPE